MLRTIQILHWASYPSAIRRAWAHWRSGLGHLALVNQNVRVIQAHRQVRAMMHATVLWRIIAGHRSVLEMCRDVWLSGLKYGLFPQKVSRDFRVFPLGFHWKFNPAHFCHPFLRTPPPVFQKVKIEKFRTEKRGRKREKKRTARTQNVHKSSLSKNTFVEKFNPAHFLNKLFKPS